MIESIQPQPTKMPWEHAAPAHSLPLPAMSPFPALSRPERLDITLGRRHLLEIAMDRSWEFGKLPPETSIILRAGILQHQKESVERGRGSAVSLAALLLQCGDIEGARKVLGEAPKEDYWSEHMRAMCSWQAGELPIAEDILRSLASANAQDPRPLHALGKLLSEQHKFSDSVMLLRAAHALEPESLPILNDLGAVLIAAGQPREALRELRVAMRLAPKYALALANSGVAHYQLKHKIKAIDFFRRALAVDDRCIVAVHNLAECLLERQEWDTVGDVLRKHIEQVPHDARAHELLAWAHMSANRVREAQKVLEQGSRLRNHRDAGLLNNLATVYESLNDASKAQTAFQSAIDLDPGNSLIRANFAHFLANHNEWPGVVRILRPSDIDSVSDRAALLARALLETGAVSEAVHILYLAASRFPKEVRFVLMLGFALASRLGRPSEAIEVCREALKTHENDLVANNLGYALILTEQLDEARKVLEPVYHRQKAGSGTTALCVIASYGLLNIREGHYDAGIALYREAHRRAVGSTKQRIKQKILVEEGRRFSELGNLTKARKALNAAAAGHDIEFRAQAEQLLATLLD
jgi:Flp pilus assembly protein TadD